MTFAQRQNRQMMHFSERIPIVKWRVSVFETRHFLWAICFGTWTSEHYESTDVVLSFLYSWCKQEAFHLALKTCGSRVVRAKNASTLGICYGTATRKCPASSSLGFDSTEHTYGIRILKELLRFISVWWALRRWPTRSVSRVITGVYTYILI
jgi:hypothetical protein